jgi:outer membrane protein assembly factor BamB
VRVLIFSTIICTVVALTGCQTVSKDHQPTPLPDYQAKIHVNEIWHNDNGHGSSGYYLRLKPAAGAHTVYTASFDGGVKAIDKADGQTLWHQQLDDRLTSGIGLGHHYLYVASEEGDIYALKRSGGQIMWHRQLSNEVLAAPHHAHNRLFVKTEDGQLYALNAATGHTIWTHQEDNPSLILRASSEAQTDSGLVFAGFANGKIIAFAQANGHVVWQRNLGKEVGDSPIKQMTDIDAKPIVNGNTVFAVSYQGYLAAIDIQSGKVKWRREIEAYNDMAIDSSRLYVTDDDGVIWAFNQTNGAKMWRMNKLQGRQLTGVAIVNDQLVVADRTGYLHWLYGHNGQLIGRYHVSGGFSVPPLARDANLWAYSENGRLYQLKAH